MIPLFVAYVPGLPMARSLYSDKTRVPMRGLASAPAVRCGGSRLVCHAVTWPGHVAYGSLRALKGLSEWAIRISAQICRLLTCGALLAALQQDCCVSGLQALSRQTNRSVIDTFVLFVPLGLAAKDSLSGSIAVRSLVTSCASAAPALYTQSCFCIVL